MMQHYSHIRKETKRKALDALAAIGESTDENVQAQTPNGINHGTTDLAVGNGNSMQAKLRR
jgi:hypothetical protein